MKLISIQDREVMLARQIFHLLWALPAFEQIPEFRGLQERCIITITPPVSHLTSPKKTIFNLCDKTVIRTKAFLLNVDRSGLLTICIYSHAR